MKALDLIGQRFGKLVVEKRVGHIFGKRDIYWNCKCDCGNYVDVSTQCLRGGNTKSCGCYRKDLRKINGIIPAINRAYGSYKGTAAKKGHAFNLSKPEFLRLVTDRCFYCGIEPQNVTKPAHYDDREPERYFIHNGIDRVDNTKGYEIDNVVTCCSVCNYAKRDMPKDVFLNWVNRIYKYSVAGIEEKTPAMIVDELATTLIKCFMAQEDLMNPNLNKEEQLEASHKAQTLNARRNRLITTLDKLLGFKDNTPTKKTYDKTYADSNS